MTSEAMSSLSATQPHHSAVILFYKYFVPSETCPLLPKHADYYVNKLLRHQEDLCTRLGLKGRVLLSIEGINGSLSGESQSHLQEYRNVLDNFDLIRDCGVPDGDEEEAEQEEVHYYDSSSGLEKKRNPYADIDWKESSVDDDSIQPFPDLKISLVSEIVSTGGLVKVDEIPQFGGRHLTPEEFHQALLADNDSRQQNDENDSNNNGKEIVLIDVRNTFEYDIGHFVNPKSQKPAMNPSMVTFSTFDSNFCAKYADDLKDKKVLMYCTGGIRCEKASAMLRKRGVNDVFQLKGGIHRYLEQYGDAGFFRGKNFVFDQRVALLPTAAAAAAAPSAEPKQPHHQQQQQQENAIQQLESSNNWIVGICVECAAPFEELCGSRICTVCRDLVLVCPTCQVSLREYHCRRHAGLKHCYFTFLEVFDQAELAEQKKQLKELHETLLTPADSKNVRRTITRQIAKIDQRIDQLISGQATHDPRAPRRCRTCMESCNVCDGRCWGFWKFQKTTITATQHDRNSVGDCCEASFTSRLAKDTD